MNDFSGNNGSSAIYWVAAVYFGLVGFIAVVVNLSIITVYIKNEKVSFYLFVKNLKSIQINLEEGASVLSNASF
jgi:hypothetical protein